MYKANLEEVKYLLLTLKSQLFESLNINSDKKLIKEADDDFGFDAGDLEDEKAQEENSSNTSYTLPFQLKVALLANNLDEKTSTLFDAYDKYIPQTKDIRQGDNDAIVNRAGIPKIDKFGIEEFNRLKKNKHKAVAFVEEKYTHLSPKEQENISKWLKDKNFNAISYANGKLTDRGKAALNFLGAFLSGTKTSADDELLFTSKYKSAFQNNAIRILYSFYNLVMANFMSRMLNKPVEQLTSEELMVVEEAVSKTINELVSGKYDASYNNLGAWFITSSINALKDYVKSHTKQVVDFNEVKEELLSRQTANVDGLIKIKSKISPKEIKSYDGSEPNIHYSNVEKIDNGLYVYTYKEVIDALSDFNGGITETGKIIPPLTHLQFRYLPIEERNSFYKGERKTGPAHAEGYGKEAHEQSKEDDFKEYKNMTDSEIVDESKKLLTRALEYVLNRTDFTTNNINKSDASALYKKKQVEKTKQAYEDAKAKGSKNTEAFKNAYEQRVNELENTKKTQKLLIDYVYTLLGNVKPTEARKAFDVNKSYKEISELTNDFNAETLRQFKQLPENRGIADINLINELKRRKLWIDKDMAATISSRLMSVLGQFFSSEDISKKSNNKNQEIWNNLVELLSYHTPSMYTQRTFEEQKNALMENIRVQVRKTLKTLLEATEDDELFYDGREDKNNMDIQGAIQKILSGRIPEEINYDSALRRKRVKEYDDFLIALYNVYKNENTSSEDKSKISNFLIYSFFPKGTNSHMIPIIGDRAGIKEMYKLPKDHEYFDMIYDAALDNFNYILDNYDSTKAKLATFVYNSVAKRFLNELKRLNTYQQDGERYNVNKTSMDTPLDSSSEGEDERTMHDVLASTDNQEKAADKQELSNIIFDYMNKNIALNNTEKSVLAKVKDGLKPEEIAEELGMDGRNVRVALWRMSTRMTQDIKDNEFGSYVYNTIGFDVNNIKRIKDIVDGKENFTFYFIGLNEWYNNNDVFVDVLLENIIEKLIK